MTSSSGHNLVAGIHWCTAECDKHVQRRRVVNILEQQCTPFGVDTPQSVSIVWKKDFKSNCSEISSFTPFFTM
jgi:hypothetical protein